MTLDRARESLQAADLCLREGFVNSAASRAYYALFQAAQVALERTGFASTEWSHAGLQATFSTELIHRRKIYPAVYRDYLSAGLQVRQAADYSTAGVSRKVASRLFRRATTLLTAVREGGARWKRVIAETTAESWLTARSSSSRCSPSSCVRRHR